MKILKINHFTAKLHFAVKDDAAEKSVRWLYSTEGDKIEEIKDYRTLYKDIISEKTLLKFWKEDIDNVLLGYWTKNGVCFLHKPIDFYETIQNYEGYDILSIEKC